MTVHRAYRSNPAIRGQESSSFLTPARTSDIEETRRARWHRSLALSRILRLRTRKTARRLDCLWKREGDLPTSCRMTLPKTPPTKKVRAHDHLEPVVPNGALGKALEGQPSAEARRRLGMPPEKLEGLPGVNLGVCPPYRRESCALGPDTLLARNREGLRVSHVRVRGDVAEAYARVGFGPGLCGDWVGTPAEKDAQPRQVAVRVLASMGKAVAAALPALWAGLYVPIPNVGTNCQSAIGTIETAKDEPGATERAEKTKAVARGDCPLL